MANSRYLRLFLVGEGGFFRRILAGARRHRLVNRRRDRVNRTAQRGLNRKKKITVGADPVRLVRFEVPSEFSEYASVSVAGEDVRAVGVIGGECPTRFGGEISGGGRIGGYSVFVFHSWSARANCTLQRRRTYTIWYGREWKMESNYGKVRENAEREREIERGKRKLGFLFGFGWELRRGRES